MTGSQRTRNKSRRGVVERHTDELVAMARDKHTQGRMQECANINSGVFGKDMAFLLRKGYVKIEKVIIGKNHDTKEPIEQKEYFLTPQGFDAMRVGLEAIKRLAAQE